MDQNLIHLGHKFNSIVEPKPIDASKLGAGWPILYLTISVTVIVLIYTTYRILKRILRKRKLINHLSTEPISQRYDLFRALLSKKRGQDCNNLNKFELFEQVDSALDFTPQDLELMIALKYGDSDLTKSDIGALDLKLINLIRRS